MDEASVTFFIKIKKKAFDLPINKIKSLPYDSFQVSEKGGLCLFHDFL